MRKIPLIAGLAGVSTWAAPTHPGDPTVMGMIGTFALFGALLMLYPLPFFIAAWREKRTAMVLGVVNLFFGWTCFGWLICLAWALTPDRPNA
jgi:hypothetical protein